MCGYVQQQVSSSFELDGISQAFPDLFFQGQYKIDVIIISGPMLDSPIYVRYSEMC